ncbi:MAG: ABC transporter permease [Gammaproteobacteria bacterium]|nr:ABC transporter permease [Gammaproteobacteria bacterium]
MNPHGTWIAFRTILRKEVTRFMRIWPQTLVPPVITMVLYFIIFGTLIGTRIGEMGGFSYMEYITPGLIMMSVTNSAYSNTVSSFFSAKFQRSIEEMLISPVPNYVIILGFALGGVLRGLIIGVLVTATSLFFTKLSVHHLAVTLSIVVLTALLFSLGGLVNAIFARSFDDISIVPTFVLTPLTYLGGVFYSINLLPEFWQGVSKANPILYMVNAFRYGILGVSDIRVEVAFTMIAAAILLLFALINLLLNRGTGLRS